MSFKIITFHTASHNGLYDTYFLPSLLRHEPDARVEDYIVSVESDGDFLSLGFQRTIYLRLVGQLRAMENYGPDDILLSMDVDMVILRPFLADLRERMERDHLDIVYQSEDPEEGMNAGLFAFRCNSRMRGFLYDVLVAALASGGHMLEQYWMNELLPTSGLHYGLLPPSLYPNATNRGLCEDSLLYHATCTDPRDGRSSIELKTEVMHSLVNTGVG
ncbi:MAG: hypothetical protein EON58_14395 [Alphaproteobacteria bacterium]|nr:MAG: hypothetical protein EON58_14395 [Alphaproteobacteria bacterium]